MKISKYIVITTIDESKSLLFSTLSRALIKIDNTKLESLKRGDISFFSEVDIKFLKDKHFIVSDDVDEIKFLKTELTRNRLSPKSFATYIALTTLCNFSCVYCYEKGQINEHTIMSDDTLSDTLKWYENVLNQKRYQECRVCLYGGEPLLYPELLIKFVDGIKAITANLNVNLVLTMISNGYLFDGKIKDYLLENGLQEVQVTLDGCASIHDKRRMLVSGEGTFTTIINNLIKLKNTELKIVIRVSFDETNVKEIKDLLHYLVSIDMNKRVLLYFAPIHQTETQKVNSCSFCSQHIYSNYGQIADIYIELYKTSKKLGFITPTCYTNGPCMVIASDACLISPDGNLYKCVEMIGKSELCIGNVKDNFYNGIYYDFLNLPQVQECIDGGCKYAPICGSGCTMEAYIRSGNFSNKACHSYIFERLISELNKMKISE